MLGVMVIFNFVHPSEVKALLCGGKRSKAFIKLETIREPPKTESGAEMLP